MSSIADLEKRIVTLEDQVEKSNELIQQLKGAGLFLKICFIVAPTIGAAVLWAKHHINF